METLTLGYGRGDQQVTIPKNNLLGCLRPKKMEKNIDEEKEIIYALNHPVGLPKLRDIVKPGERVAVIISDITRPCPSAKMLPHVLDELNRGGVSDKDVVVVSALGSHRPHKEEELKKLIGPVYERVACIDSYGDDFVEVGTSSRGTPFQVFRPVVEADKRICLGNIDYHYFAGYSGGAKAIVPGVCTRATIQANHQMMLSPGARVGLIKDNPVREDIEEIIKFLSIDFILNVVLDDHKKIMGAVAGHFVKAHRAGCKILDQAYRLPIKELADIVVTCPGGFPKDINVYQAQKALDNAQWAVKPGGIIILLAQCSEGFGEKTFEKWLEEANTPEDIIKRIYQDFRLGGHKAAAIATLADKYKIFLVSDLAENQVEKLFMKSFSAVQEAFDEAFREKGSRAKVWVMPTGGTTLPEHCQKSVKVS
ncbi:MAG: nickel-dependent lactate racemase [Desulfitobacteriaceae bacterium]|nr:nickel-dependent lactate racemase [Desulfitobacteriaceae bacterium]